MPIWPIQPATSQCQGQGRGNRGEWHGQRHSSVANVDCGSRSGPIIYFTVVKKMTLFNFSAAFDFRIFIKYEYRLLLEMFPTIATEISQFCHKWTRKKTVCLKIDVRVR